MMLSWLEIWAILSGSLLFLCAVALLAHLLGLLDENVDDEQN